MNTIIHKRFPDISESAIKQILIAKLQDSLPVKNKVPLLLQKINSFHDIVDAIVNLQEIFDLEDDLLLSVSYASLNHTQDLSKTCAMDLSFELGISMQKSESTCSKSNPTAEYVFKFSAIQNNDSLIRCQRCFKLGHEAKKMFSTKF